MLVFDGKGVSSVIDDLEVVVVGNTLDRVNGSGVPVAMHGHDGCRLRRDGGLDFVRVEVERLSINVDKDGLDAVP